MATMKTIHDKLGTTVCRRCINSYFKVELEPKDCYYDGQYLRSCQVCNNMHHIVVGLSPSGKMKLLTKGTPFEEGDDTAPDAEGETSEALSFPKATLRPPLPVIEEPDQADNEEQTEGKITKRPLLRVLPVFAGVVLLTAVFFILYFVLKPSESAGEENKTSSKAAAESPSVSEVVTPSVTIDPTAANLPSSSHAPTQTSDVVISLPDEYQIWGTGEYKLSHQEHDMLLKDVHQYVEEKVSEYTKSKDAFFPHFESIAVNEDCTLFTVTVNDGYTRTPYETGLPEQLCYYSALYAAFSQKEADSFTVAYQSMVGNVLESDSYPVS